MEGHDQTGGIDQCKEGVSCFPSRQCSIHLCSAATTNLSHSSLSRKTNVQSFSLSTPLAAIYDRAPIPHIHTPSKHLNSNESPTKILDDIQAHDFSINHRSAPWLVTTPIIDLGLDSLVDISCICMQVPDLPADITKHACPRDLLIENDASPRIVNLIRTNKDRSRAGESLKLR